MAAVTICISLWVVIHCLFYVEVGSFYVYILESFYHKWMLDFVERFLCIYWDDHIVFIFHLLLSITLIDLCILENLYIPGINPTWSCCDQVLLDSVCLNFVENFCIHTYQWYWPLIFFISEIFVWFLYQGNGGLVESLWQFPFLCNFLEELE